MMPLRLAVPLAVALAVAIAGAAGEQLQIYFIDVEGGQSTLIVTPQRRAVLIDAGWSVGNRDADRIQAAARDAGVTELEYLFITHFHEDHAGGAAEIARRVPVKTFVDYGEPIEAGAFAQQPFATYAQARARGRQLHPKPGDQITLDDIVIDVVSSGGALVSRPLPGVTASGDVSCPQMARTAADTGENPRSLGVRLRYGNFSFLDLGDLPGVNLAALVCPRNLLGHSDVYLVPHHGNADTAFPFVISAVSPRVAILNNGVAKGGDPLAFEALRAARLEDVWQLHHSDRPNAANFGNEFVVNLASDPDHGASLKVTADRDGSFSVTNGRTRTTKAYSRRVD